MIKYAIKLHDNNHDAHLIFHATPTWPPIDPFYKHQWYLTEDENSMGFPIQEESYEMYTTTTEQIKEKGYDGWYLYCKRTDIKTFQENNTEFIRLYSDIYKIINSGTVFDDISAYDENGNILAIACEI